MVVNNSDCLRVSQDQNQERESVLQHLLLIMIITIIRVYTV